MRVTNSMMVSTYLSDLNRNAYRLNNYQSQLATGRRLVRLSDDPVGAINSLRAREKLSKIEQYQDNVEQAKSWLTQTETAVMDLNSIAQRAYELSVQATGGVYSPTEKAAIQKEIDQLKQQTLSTLNATLGDKYLFGGYNFTSEPFTTDASGNLIYNGVQMVPDPPADPTDPVQLADYQAKLAAVKAFSDDQRQQTVQYEIGKSNYITVSVPGVDVMGKSPNDLYTVLKEFSAWLSTDGTTGETGLQNTITKLQDCQKDILANAAELGGRQNRLDLAGNRYEQDYINYSSIRSQVEDVDQTETIMQYMMAQAVYNASLAVGSKVIQPSLVDFLG